MFSLDRFYHILHDNLISNFPGSLSFYFYPFGTYDNKLTLGYQKNFEEDISNDPGINSAQRQFECWFYDQEPLFPSTVSIPEYGVTDISSRKRIILLANSEKSELKNSILRSDHYFYDWYYFFHGFAALDWYRDFEYFDNSFFEDFDKVFICYNHLTSKYRSYRLHLIANLLEDNLHHKGHVSFFLADKDGSWRDEILDPNCPLSTQAKIKVFKNLQRLTEPLTIDTTDPIGSLSASVTTDWVNKALWHVVTETIYFQPKLHLTEKVFKPIVSKRPFILVAAPGNLAYLKSYGFKTFDKWIDESYDQETDDYLRIEKITQEIRKLSQLDKTELKKMQREMQEILDFNHRHFFGDFKKIIVNELVDNFCNILMQVNNGRQPNNHSKHHYRYVIDQTRIEEIKSRLLK